MEVKDNIDLQHIHLGSLKSETKISYVEVPWGSSQLLYGFYVNLFSPRAGSLSIFWPTIDQCNSRNGTNSAVNMEAPGHTNT